MLRWKRGVRIPRDRMGTNPKRLKIKGFGVMLKLERKKEAKGF